MNSAASDPQIKNNHTDSSQFVKQLYSLTIQYFKTISNGFPHTANEF